jgi:hypothetical protein
MVLVRRGQMVPRYFVVPTVNSFTQATRTGIAHRPPLSVEEAGLLKVAAAAANPHSDLRLQARMQPLWAKNGAARLALALGVTT